MTTRQSASLVVHGEVKRGNINNTAPKAPLCCGEEALAQGSEFFTYPDAPQYPFRPKPEGDTLRLRPLRKADGPILHSLVSQCPPLDLNSVYLYLLLTEHFPQTCILAEDSHGVVGMVSAYCPPGRPDVLFVWQVAVHPRMRGLGLGGRMLRHLLRRPSLGAVRWVETTVGPGNQASRRLFARLADRLAAPLAESPLFEAAHFGADAHEAEPLLRIGPISLSAVN